MNCARSMRFSLITLVVLAVFRPATASPYTIFFDGQIDTVSPGATGISTGDMVTISIQFDTNQSLQQKQAAGPGYRYFFNTDTLTATISTNSGSATYIATNPSNSLALIRDNSWMVPFNLPGQYQLDGLTLGLYHSSRFQSAGNSYDQIFSLAIRNTDLNTLNVINNKFPTQINFNPGFGQSSDPLKYNNSFGVCNVGPLTSSCNGPGSFTGHITGVNPVGGLVPPGWGLTVSKSLALLNWYRSTAQHIDSVAGASFAVAKACAAQIPFACASLAVMGAGLTAFEAYQFAKIVNDPPDPNFSLPYESKVLTPKNYDSTSGIPDDLLGALNAYAFAHTRFASAVVGWRHSLERLVAAMTAGDSAAIALQQESLNQYIQLASSLADEIEADDLALADLVSKYFGSISLSESQFSTYIDYLRAHGLDSTELASLSEMGLTSDDLIQIGEIISSLPPAVGSVEWSSMLRTNSQSMEELSSSVLCSTCQSAIPTPSTLLLVVLIFAGLTARQAGRNWSSRYLRKVG